MNCITIIHPRDRTTNFLEEVTSFLTDKLGRERVFIERDGNRLPRTAGFNQDLLVYMGHGNSECFYGQEGRILLNKMDLHSLENRQVLFLACRSSEFLQKSNIHSITFGNIPTSMDEIWHARNGHANRYYGVVESDIEIFNKSLVSVCQSAILNTMESNGSLHYLFLHLRLMMNREINRLVRDNKDNLEEVEGAVNLICKMKREVCYTW